jgi:hypothetical protein
MRNWEIIDESCEVLLDRLYLIYTHFVGSVGRLCQIGESFHILDADGNPMNCEQLESVLREFQVLCDEPTGRWRWNQFPKNAHPRYKLFRGIRLRDREWFLLQDFLEHEWSSLLVDVFPQRSFIGHFPALLKRIPNVVFGVLKNTQSRNQ